MKTTTSQPRMAERWINLQMGTDVAADVTLVIDASDSATKHWETIQHFVLDLLRSYPPVGEPRIYFLGDGQRRATDSLTHSRYREENRRRARLITPVFESLTEGNGPIVVLRVGRVFDLEDWVGTPLLQRTSFVSFGDPPTDGSPAELPPNLDLLRRQLFSRPLRVTVKGSRAMPFRWDNVAYRYRAPCLLAERASSFALHAGFISPTGRESEEFVAHADLDNGTIQRLSLSGAPPLPPQINRTCTALTPTEASLFRECIRNPKGNYRCPVCKSPHPAHDLYCQNELGALGKPVTLIYRTIAEELYSTTTHPHTSDSRAVLIVGECEGSVRFYRAVCPVLRLAQDAIAIIEGDHARVHRYESNLGTWEVRPEPVSQYYQLRDGTHAIVL